MKIPFKPIKLEDANIFSLENIRKKYWKDFYDNCHSRLEYISHIDTYEDKYESYKSFHIINSISNRSFPIIPLEWDTFMPLKVNDHSLIKFQNAYKFFLNLQTEDNAVLPMLMVLLKMQESIELKLNADAEMLEYLYPRECFCDFENHNRYKVVYDETKPIDDHFFNEISLSEKEIIEWLSKERKMDEDWSGYLNHASDEETVSGNGIKTAVTLGNLSIDLISCIIENYNQSLTKFEEIYFEKITMKRCDFKKALLYRLYKTYLISSPKVLNIFDETPSNLVKRNLLETRKQLIQVFKETQLGSKWCDCIEYENGLEYIGRFLINHRDEITEEEEKHFFFLLDEICLITDILIGMAKNEWPNAEYVDEDASDEHFINQFQKGVASFVTYTNRSDDIIKLLLLTMEGKIKPKDIMMPVRAAMEAGVIRRPTWDEFCKVFGAYRISKSSFTFYTDPREKKYEGEHFGTMILIFQKYKET